MTDAEIEKLILSIGMLVVGMVLGSYFGSHSE